MKQIDLPLIDELLATITTELSEFHAILSMCFLAAGLGCDPVVDNLPAIRAVPHGCVVSPVIQIRAGNGLHRVLPGCLRNRCLRNRDPTTIADGNSQLRSAYTKRTDFIGCPRNRAESAVERGDDGV